MRIKRFIAPDMRTALRMVRDEQGPDAVILSNRPVDGGGIEIVAATDYDESLAQQALRAAMPAMEPTAAVPVAAAPVAAPVAASNAAKPASLAPAALAAAVARPDGRVPESRIRGRAVFAIDEAAPAFEQRMAAPVAHASMPADEISTPSWVAKRETVAAAKPETATAPKQETVVAARHDAARPDTSRFDAMMAALIPPGERFDTDVVSISSQARQAHNADALPPPPRVRAIEGEGSQPVPEGSGVQDDAERSSSGHAPEDAPRLRIVADKREADPGLVAMRDELATMRQLIERELGQMAGERLRGSPARAAAYDALLGYGCDDALAQSIAGRIDPRMNPSEVRETMFAELARALTVARAEPLDDGGVIALVGPTGAGKTTTAAKLAARFAQRHRARDVALVTTDTERAGASEQLHILGRRLGITVCEAAGPEALNEALDQLADYPLVLVDTAGHGMRDRALLGQILWLRAARRVRSLLVLPANTQAHDLSEVVRRYRPASPEGVVLTKLDETGRLGSALSVMVQHGLSLAYTTDGQQVPGDLAAADATGLVSTLEKVRRAADNPLGSLDNRQPTLPTEDRHAIAS